MLGFNLLFDKIIDTGFNLLFFTITIHN